MDPQVTLKLCAEDVEHKVFRSALVCLLDYYNWRVNGGFQPHNGDNIARDLGAKIQDGLSEAY